MVFESAAPESLSAGHPCITHTLVVRPVFSDRWSADLFTRLVNFRFFLLRSEIAITLFLLFDGGKFLTVSVTSYDFLHAC